MKRIELEPKEIEALLDALKKGISRHESYAKFYPKRASKHQVTAQIMRKLQARLSHTG